MLIHILAILLLLSFLVFIHELGHFLLAKKVGVRVLEFGFGYPPRIKKLFHWRGTDFTLNWIPFGGFVHLAGEDGAADAKLKVERGELFFHKSIGQRLAIILAGPAINFIFGYLAFLLMILFLGVPIKGARIGELAPNSPAARAQLPIGGEIVKVAVDNQAVEVENIEQVVDFISRHRGQEIELTATDPCQGLECPSDQQTFQVYVRTPEETPADQGAIGVTFQTSVVLPLRRRLLPSLQLAAEQTWQAATLVLTSLKKMMRQLAYQRKMPQDLSGPVGIVYFAQKAKIVDQGFWFLLNLAALLSINLAVINILPIPALDGGRAFFILLEKIIKPSHLRHWEKYAISGGYLFLLLLIILITFKDIWTIFS